MLLPLAVASIAAATITIDSRGGSVAKLLKEASKQSGVTMESIPATGEEVVLVSLKSVSPEEFRKRLAVAIGAKWIEEGRGFRLVRPVDMVRAQEADEMKLRIAQVEHGMALNRKRIADRPSFDKEAAEALARKVRALYEKFKGHLSDGDGLRGVMQLEPDSPSGRFAISAVSLLTAKQLAEVAKGQRIVYSTNPTQMQRKFPADLAPATRQYVAEQKLYVEALKRIPMSEGWANSWSAVLTRQTPEMPSQILLSTQRSLYNDGFTVRACLVGADGKYLAQVQTLLDFNEGGSGKELAKGTVKLSEDSQRFMEALKGLQSGKPFVEDQALLSKMERPEENDPLSMHTADGLFALAEGGNFIACVPDDGFHMPAFMAMTPDGTLDLAKYSKWLTSICNVDRTKEWMVATPKMLVATRRLRCDRSALGTFFRAQRKGDGPTIEQLAEFVTKMPESYGETFVPMMAFFLLPSLNAGVDDRNYELLRIYGRLQPAQRNALMRGEPIQIGALPPASKADLNRLTFRADTPVNISFAGPVPDEALRYGLSQEITYVLANGLPSGGTMSMTSNGNEAVIPDGTGQSVSSLHPLGAWALAYALVSAEFADPTDKREQVTIEKFRYGRSRRIDLRVQFTENVAVSADVTETHFPPAGKSVPYESLPLAFREAVEKAKVEVRKQHFSGEKGKVPPP